MESSLKLLLCLLRLRKVHVSVIRTPSISGLVEKSPKTQNGHSIKKGKKREVVKCKTVFNSNEPLQSFLTCSESVSIQPYPVYQVYIVLYSLVHTG